MLEVTLSDVTQRLKEKAEALEARLEAAKHNYLLAYDKAHRATMKAKMGGGDKERTAATRAREALAKARERRKELAGRVRETAANVGERIRTETSAARRQQALDQAVASFAEKFLRDYDRRVAGRRKPGRPRKDKAD